MEDPRTRFEQQVLPHLDAAYRFALWLTRSRADADDVVQEAMLRALRGIGGLRGTDGKTWLLTIVRNCHATAAAQQRRRSYVPLDEDRDTGPGSPLGATPDPQETTVSEDEVRALERILLTLPTEHREVLVLREVEDLSYREIALVTRAPIGTVMSRLARARAALRALWRREQEDGNAVR